MKLRRSLTIVECIIIALFILFLGLFYIFVRRPTEKIDANSDLWFNSWDKDFIEDVYVADLTKACEERKDFEPLFEYNWSGTEDYCICEKDGEKVVQENCKSDKTDDGIEKGCEFRPQTAPRELTTWKSGVKICGKMMKGINFRSMASKMQNDGTCEDGHKLCGEEDSPEDQVCIPTKYENCPITDLEISEDNPKGTHFKEKVDYSGKTKLWISRTERIPLTDCTIAEDGMCFNLKKDRKTQERPMSQVLLLDKTDQCEVDPRWDKIDEWSELEFFKMNKLPVEKLKEAQVASEKYNYHLLMQNALPIKPNCRKNLDNFNGITNKMSDARSRYKLFFWVGIVCLILLTLLITLWIVSIIKKKPIFYMIRMILVLLIMLIVIIFLAIGCYQVNSHSKESDFLVHNQCIGDDYTNDKLEGYYKKYIGRPLKVGMICLLAFIILFIALIVLFILQMIKGKKSKNYDAEDLSGNKGYFPQVDEDDESRESRESDIYDDDSSGGRYDEGYKGYGYGGYGFGDSYDREINPYAPSNSNYPGYELEREVIPNQFNRGGRGGLGAQGGYYNPNQYQPGGYVVPYGRNDQFMNNLNQ